MANYFIVKVTIDDGSGAPAPKIVSDLDNGSLQFTSVISADIVKKWAVTGFDESDATELANFYSQVKE